MKNILYLNQKNHNSSRKGFYLGGLAVLLLSGCDTTNLIDGLTGTRSEQQLNGGRRIPNLNPRRAVSAKVEPTKEPTKTPSQTASNPYDMYDAGGNEIVKSSKESTDAGNDSNTFSKFIDSNFSAPKQPAVTSPAPSLLEKDRSQEKFIVPAPQENGVVPKNNSEQIGHKPLAGNPYSPEGSVIIPLVQMKIEEPKPVEKPVEKFKEIENSNINLEIPKEEAKIEAKEDFFDRIGAYFSFDSKEEPKKNDLQSDYPKISSVPAKPEEFETIKQDQQQNFNDLKLEYNIAEQEKLSLETEISGEPPTKPLSPLKQPITPVVTPVVAKENIEEKELGLKQPSFEQKIIALPTPILDEEISKKDEAVVVIEDKKPALEQPNFYQNNALPPVTEIKSLDKSEEKPSYFDNLIKSLSEEFDSAAPSSSPVVVESMPSAAVPATNIDNKVEMNNVISSSDISSASEKEDKNKTLDSQSSFEPASKVIGNTLSLPSPEIIKSIPPSRYEGLRSKSNSAY